MLSYLKNQSTSGSDHIGYHTLTINGEPVDRDIGFVMVFGKDVSAHVNNPDLYEQIAEMTVDQVLWNISSIKLWYPNYFDEAPESFLIDEIEIGNTKEDKIYIKFNLKFDVDEWSGPWRMKDHAQEFVKLFSEQNIAAANVALVNENLSDEETVFLNEVIVYVEIDKTESSINLILNEYIAAIESVNQKALVALKASAKDSSVVAVFNFPEEVKISCEQYLSGLSL